MFKRYKSTKGITLVALVITIVILLILAGISISTLTNTGIFQKAKEAKQKSENATLEQNKLLDNYEKEVDQYLPAFTGTTVKEAIQHGRVLNAANNTELYVHRSLPLREILKSLMFRSDNMFAEGCLLALSGDGNRSAALKRQIEYWSAKDLDSK